MQLIAKSTKAHYQKYSDMAKVLHMSYKNYQSMLGYTKEELIEKFKEDKNLNNIPLPKWDIQASFIPNIKYNGFTLSLAEKVCLLKHLAIYDIIGAVPEFEG
ncbi:MAG: hypothetical protein WC917_02995 [Bacilli bacterium]|jgi:hypothetical protein